VYSDICAAFDNVEHLLRERRFERPLRIIGAGLDIRFDDEGLTEYKHAVASDENTEKFVEATSYAADMYANMDW